jgi:hypothetical protein
LTDGTLGQPSAGLRDIKIISANSSVEVDGGTSKNILGDDDNKGNYTLTLEEQQTQAGLATIGNFFPIESNTTIVTLRDSLNNPVSVTAEQNAITNFNFFTKGGTADVPTNELGSSYSQAFIEVSKLDPQNPLSFFGIKRGKVVGKGESGNELLPRAAIKANAGGSYVKFTSLNQNIGNYTAAQLQKNLYKSDTGDNSTVSEGDFFGPKQLYKPSNDGDDDGTFDKIKSDPSKRAVTREVLFERVVDEISGENAPGGISNAYKPDLAPTTNLFNFTEGGYPLSPTEAQNSANNAGQYVLPIDLAGYVKLQSSYSNEVIDSGFNNLIKRGKTNKNAGAPDGNTLLKDAAPTVTGNSFVKTTSERSPTIDAYVTSVLNKNRYNPSNFNQFVPADTPGAQSIFNIGPDGSKGGQNFNNISDDVDSGERGISFVERTKLYAPSQLKLGESPQSTINNVPGGELKGFTFRRLTRIGTILQLRAAGEATFITGADDDDPRSNLEQLAAALIPGLGQAGAGIPLSREYLNVTEIIKNLPDDDLTGTLNTAAQYEGELIDISRNFEGVVNTALEKFAGFSSLGLLILAIVLVAVIILVLWGLIGNIAAASSSLNKGKDSPGGEAAENSLGIRGLGSFQGRPIGGGTNIVADIVQASVDKSAATALFGIKPTYNREYSDAVYRGSLAFFGLGAAPPPLLAYPGQVIVTSRAIVRGVSELVKAFADIGNAFATGNIFSAIFKLIDIIEIIRNSKVIKALNTFSQLGDRRPYTIIEGVEKDSSSKPASSQASQSEQPAQDPSKTQENITQDTTSGLFGGKELYQQNDKGGLDVGVKISEIDSITNQGKHKIYNPDGTYRNDYIGISQFKNRLQNSRALAWSSYRSPSLLLLPNRTTNDALNELAGSSDLDKNKKIKDTQSLYASTNSIVENRISNKLVEQFENALDGEYMPFSFQDLRTNEILSFHAFLLSLNEDYTANYESISGLGRIEPIKTYKDTQRKIGLSFILAALDKNDFDHMWEKVNRLTMMVYPQFTRGKLYKNPENKVQFDKPFTQMIGASPMVRLRLGNLFRSNYSRFNLAGIFGLNAPGAIIPKADGETIEVNKDNTTTSQKTAGNITEKSFEADTRNYYKADYTYLIEEGTYLTRISEDEAKRIGVEVNKSPAPPAPTAPNPSPDQSKHFIADGDWYKVFAADANSNSKLRFKIEKVFPESQQVIEYALGTFIVEPGATDKEKTEMTSPNGKKYYVKVDSLALSPASLKQYQDAKAKAIDSARSAARPEVVAFMSPEKNAIVKSFESTAGKGLAGFIDSVGFDWYDKVTWDINMERKAPKMCKITISFTPVHDIAPGLDSFGNNRAPIYPLGPYAHGTRKDKDIG